MNDNKAPPKAAVDQAIRRGLVMQLLRAGTITEQVAKVLLEQN